MTQRRTVNPSNAEAAIAAESYARLYGVQRNPGASPEPPSPDFGYDRGPNASYHRAGKTTAYGNKAFEHYQQSQGLSQRSQQQPPNGSRPRQLLDDYETAEVYEQPRLHLATRIPKIEQQLKDGIEEDDQLISPRRIAEGVESLTAMVDAGAGWGSALMSALQGHKMTEEQAAICLQSHWRRHEAKVQTIARGLAAEHIQNAYRERMYIREEAMAEREAARQAKHEYLSERYWAATCITSGTRGFLGRAYVREMKSKKRASTASSVLRSFSFSKKKRQPADPNKEARAEREKEANKASAAAAVSAETPRMRLSMTPSAAPDDGYGTPSTPRGGGGTGASLAKRVRRSLSFDKKAHAAGGSSSQVIATACTRRTFVLERGPQGLGLELDATNTVVTIKPGGRAERQGLLVLGDTILTIDGRTCAGALMQDVMVPGRTCYVVEVSRPERCAPTPAKPANIIRRSLSFDSKKSGGVKRSFSFDRKRRAD